MIDILISAVAGHPRDTRPFHQFSGAAGLAYEPIANSCGLRAPARRNFSTKLASAFAFVFALCSCFAFAFAFAFLVVIPTLTLSNVEGRRGANLLSPVLAKDHHPNQTSTRQYETLTFEITLHTINPATAVADL